MVDIRWTNLGPRVLSDEGPRVVTNAMKPHLGSYIIQGVYPTEIPGVLAYNYHKVRGLTW